VKQCPFWSIISTTAQCHSTGLDIASRPSGVLDCTSVNSFIGSVLQNSATCSRSSRQTLAYSKDHEGQCLHAFPIIHGMKCTGWSSSDLFEDYEAAMTVLAKIAVGELGYGDAEDMAKEFFERQKEEPYSYYDPDDEDEDSSENH